MADWKIPPEGISNEENNQKWNRQLDIDTDDYYSKNWPKEREEIINLRRMENLEKLMRLEKKLMQTPR